MDPTCSLQRGGAWVPVLLPPLKRDWLRPRVPSGPGRAWATLESLKVPHSTPPHPTQPSPTRSLPHLAGRRVERVGSSPFSQGGGGMCHVDVILCSFIPPHNLSIRLLIREFVHPWMRRRFCSSTWAPLYPCDALDFVLPFQIL